MNYWILVLFMLCERVFELFYSRRNQRILKDKGYEKVEDAKTLGFMVTLHIGWLAGLIVEPTYFPKQSLPAVFWNIIFCLFIAAEVLRFWTLKTLGHYWNISVMVPREGSLGTFVKSGPYRFFPHPNYVVVVLEILTLPLLGEAYTTCIFATILNAILITRRIKLEDVALSRVAGYTEWRVSRTTA